MRKLRRKLFFISVFLLAVLLFFDLSFAARGSTSRGSRGGSSVRGGSGTSRQFFRSSSSRGSFDTRKSFDSRRGFDSRKDFGSTRKFDNRRFDKNFKKDSFRGYTYYKPSQPRRPYADTISPNAWRFNGQEKPVYKNIPQYRTYRPPAVLTDPRVSGHDYRSKSYLNYRYDHNRNYDYRYRRYPLARYDHRFRKDSPFYYNRFNRFGKYPYYNNRYYPYYPRLSGWPNYWYSPGFYGYGYYGSGYYGSSYYGSSYYGSSYYDRYDSKETYESYPTNWHFPKRYIFVSLNGYWPGYNDYRYYDYGTYPYFWYMVASTPYKPDEAYPPIGSKYDNDNPYTYYGSENEPFAMVTSPEDKTSADQYFEKGVGAFAAGNYRQAEIFFYQAKSSEPEDIILPFAYVQAIFAQGEYDKAARQLRNIIDRQPVGREWVFYPRGLYTDDSILMKQIDQLVSKATDNPDLQLLAGYQLLGVQKLDLAMEFLNKAQAGSKFNQLSAGKLLYVLNNLNTNYEVRNSGSEYLYKK
ncbi:MAG: hypothetical protein BWY69_00651 [Planctomycetes bacterium ADurb.Bin401]|nr:MAG: hypothetical protein BWY69_00651 [Planctomycetes bacterium ADurb.Bin401]